MFKRIGGYAGPGGYAIYSEGGVEHHSEIHVIEWDINDTNTLYSGTDGGVHKTTNLNTNFVRCVNLNNNYLTYQYHHINMVILISEMITLLVVLKIILQPLRF